MGAGFCVAVFVGEDVVLEGAGDAETNPVGVAVQGVLLGWRGGSGQVVGVVEEAVDESLIDDERGAAVKGPASANGVAQAIIEGSNSGTRHVGLGSLHEQRVVGNLAEVPAFSVDIDGWIDAGQLGLESDDQGLGMEAHNVETEAVDFVFAGPGQHRVRQELAHHVVFGGGVLAATAGFDQAVLIETIVVARDEFIENGEVVLAGRGGVVVDDIHDHAEAGLVEGVDHFAEFDDAGEAVGIAGVAAIRDGVENGVVAPVEAVLVAGGADGGLLVGGIGGGCGDCRVGAAAVGNAGDFEGR